MKRPDFLNGFAEPPTYAGPPVVGHAFALHHNPIQLFMDATRRSHSGVIRLTALWRVAYLLSEPELVEYVLVKNSRNYSIGVGGRRAMRFWLGDGLLTSEGNTWLQRRRLLQPLFRQHVVQLFSDMIVVEANALCKQWEQHTGQPRDVQKEMMMLALRVIARVLGVPLDQGTVARQFSDAVTAMVEFYGWWLRSPLTSLIPRSAMQQHPHFRRTLRVLDDIVFAMIAERRRSAASADLLSMLLTAQDADTEQSLTDEQVRDEVMTMLFAGHETTASGMTWMWYLLAQNPDVRDELEAELAQVLGGRLPTAADISQLPVTDAIVCEVLRLYPPIWSTFRISLAEDEIAGYHIPERSRIIISPWVLHRHLRIWPEPEQFNPARWMATPQISRPKFAWLPFGGGPRQCLGKHIALLEMKLVLATIAQQFRLRRVELQPVAPEALLTLRPHRALHMQPERRGSASG